jgi:GNAT superfamily N-acetyltransferase
MKYFLYKLKKNNPTANVVLPNGYQLHVWRPSLSITPPKGLRKISTFIWIFFHYLHIFKNNKFSIIYISYKGNIVSRLLVTPGYFRFPFMDSNDLQIGDVFTCDSHRGIGLASHILSYALGLFEKDAQSIFYVVEGTNRISIKLALSLGFELITIGTKKKLFFSFIGYYNFK